jgi:hypothetical protein
MKRAGAVVSGLTCLLAAAALSGCSSQSAEDKAVAGGTKFARGDIERTANLMISWLRSSASARSGYELAKKNLSQRSFVAQVTLLGSHFSESIQTYDVTTTERGAGDNGFGGGHIEKTVRMCARLTANFSPRPRVEVSGLHCPPGLPSTGIGGPIDRIIPWKR